MVAACPKEERTFRKFSFRGTDLDQLLDMTNDELVLMFRARIRRKFKRGLQDKYTRLVKKLRAAKKAATGGEKPEAVRTHLRNMVIVPEMIGSVVGVYNGKVFNTVEIKPEMIGSYLGEYSRAAALSRTAAAARPAASSCPSPKRDERRAGAERERGEALISTRRGTPTWENKTKPRTSLA